MNTDQLYEKLIPFGVKREEPLAQYTTWKIGGPAELFCEVKDTRSLIEILRLADKAKIRPTLLGWGSNVLIADEGIRGLVIRVKTGDIKLLGACQGEKASWKSKPRLQQVDTKNYYSFSELEYEEKADTYEKVVLDAGVYLPFAINNLIKQGVTGLQWYASIPATIGGAIFNNIHGGTHFFEEYVESVEAYSHGEIKVYAKPDLEFDYDYSRFHHSGETILRIFMCLPRGNKEKAWNASIAWAKKKNLQPHNSAGCCFKNLTEEEQKILKLESNSWGYINDKILNLKGKRVGDAVISLKHAAFIENVGSATAKDVLALFRLVNEAAKKTLGLKSTPEIFFLGFKPEQLAGII